MSFYSAETSDVGGGGRKGHDKSAVCEGMEEARVQSEQDSGPWASVTQIISAYLQGTCRQHFSGRHLQLADTTHIPAHHFDKICHLNPWTFVMISLLSWLQVGAFVSVCSPLRMKHLQSRQSEFKLTSYPTPKPSSLKWHSCFMLQLIGRIYWTFLQRMQCTWGL